MNRFFSILLLAALLTGYSVAVKAQIQGFKTEDSSERTHSDDAIIRASIKSRSQISTSGSDVYISDDWKIADIKMNGSDEVITGIPIRLDAQNNLLEIKHTGKIKTISSGNVKSIVIENENTTFITESLLNKNSPKGFYRLIYNLHSSLLCHYYTEIRQSSYNRAIDMGERGDAVIVMKDYYFLYHGEMIKLESKRKKLARQFGYNDKIYNFILSQKIDPKNEFDLVKLATYCDSMNGNS